jgi:hypothetical protein
MAQNQLTATKASAMYVDNYVSAANAAARSYKRAAVVSEEVARGIDGAAKEVEGIQIEQFVAERTVTNSFIWTLLGIILGVLFTLIVTRRSRKQISIDKVNDQFEIRIENLNQVSSTLQNSKPKPKLKPKPKKSPQKRKQAQAPKKKSRR